MWTWQQAARASQWFPEDQCIFSGYSETRHHSGYSELSFTHSVMAMGNLNYLGAVVKTEAWAVPARSCSAVCVGLGVLQSADIPSSQLFRMCLNSRELLWPSQSIPHLEAKWDEGKRLGDLGLRQVSSDAQLGPRLGEPCITVWLFSSPLWCQFLINILNPKLGFSVCFREPNLSEVSILFMNMSTFFS